MDDKHLGNTEEDPSGVQSPWWRRVFSTRRGGRRTGRNPGLWAPPGDVRPPLPFGAVCLFG